MLSALSSLTLAWWFQPPPLPPRATAPAMKLVADGIEFDTLQQVDHSPVGVLLLSVGAPETPEDVEQYLYNVFTDPEIRTLPPALSWVFKKPLAWAISRDRSQAARESMVQAGGRSPQLSTVQAQGKALQDELEERGVNAAGVLAELVLER